MIVLGTVLVALGVALTRFIPRRQLLGPPGRGLLPRPGDRERKGNEIIKHIRVPLTIASVITATVLIDYVPVW